MEGEKRVCFELKVVSNLIKRHINNSDTKHREYNRHSRMGAWVFV